MELTALTKVPLEERKVRLGYFANWMKAIQELGVERGDALSRGLENAVRSFLPGLRQSASRRQGRSEAAGRPRGDADGRLRSGSWSHGERGILAVVLDLTRRLGQANPGLEGSRPPRPVR